jgi:hypothetical protein
MRCLVRSIGIQITDTALSYSVMIALWRTAYLSGSGICTRLTNRLRAASSSSCGLFVAPTTSTLNSSSNGRSDSSTPEHSTCVSRR